MTTRAIRKTTGERFFDAFNIVALLALVTLTLYPLLYVLFASLSNPTELAQSRGLLFGPAGFSFEAYRKVFQNPSISNGYHNTLFCVGAGTLINMVMTCLGAYALSRKNVLWKTPILLMIIFTLFFSGGLIPTYLLVGKTLNWVDSPWALIIPGAMRRR